MQKLCSRCQLPRPIVVFVNRVQNNKVVGTDGYCLRCARELKLEPITSQLDKMGLTDEDIEEMEGQMSSLFGSSENDDPDGSHDAPAFDLGGLLSGLMPGAVPPMPSENHPEIVKNDPKSSKKGAKTTQKASENRKFLNQFCLDLTGKARAGALDRIVGRNEEIDRVIQILSRRAKNNPCLIGEPGVGKTAIAEGLAQRIAENKVPNRLSHKEIYVLDMTALVAGTQFRGQFENRIRALIQEVKSLGNIILMIDEIHTLVSAGDAEGGMNAANILKPALSRGEIQVIGATTLSEYRKHIEKDAALERRFQPVTVDEPSISETIEILHGVREYYENFHSIRIPDAVLSDAVHLSERYITDRFLPDKAIDLLDEAAARASLDSAILERLAVLTEERAQSAAELAEAEAETDPNDETYAKIAAAKTTLAATQEEFDRLNAQKNSVVLTQDDLAHVIELWTGISAASISENEFEKIDRLDQTLKARIIGQDEAIDAVCRAVRRRRTGVSPKQKPISFIFAGPTGVGKTELVKQLSLALFESPEALIRLDMSEFMEKHSVSRIIGSPPGYVGYDEAGQLTEKIRRKPYSVILFDEIEKAHPDVLNILLQILDDGRITDAHGKTVNFENTILIMTTNAGTGAKSAAGFSRTRAENDAEKTKKALGEFLRPEFLNRIDEIITFHALSVENCVNIANIMLKELADNLSLKGIRLNYDESVARFCAEKAYSEAFGARNLRRFLQTEAEDRIAELLVKRYRDLPDTITLTVENDALKTA